MRLSAIAGALLATASAAQAYEIVLYGEEGWTGDEVSYDIDGQHYLPFTGYSWEYFSPFNDGCCVRFCYLGEAVGYRCSDSSNYRSSSPIDEVATGCGDELLDC